ncbi:hypothetical protein KC337_g38 [Hortaea werneckii]|nr:hypothetical protein KC337_g38 [Hortaea werneckii]
MSACPYRYLFHPSAAHTTISVTLNGLSGPPFPQYFLKMLSNTNSPLYVLSPASRAASCSGSQTKSLKAFTAARNAIMIQLQHWLGGSKMSVFARGTYKAFSPEALIVQKFPFQPSFADLGLPPFHLRFPFKLFRPQFRLMSSILVRLLLKLFRSYDLFQCRIHCLQRCQYAVFNGLDKSQVGWGSWVVFLRAISQI